MSRSRYVRGGAETNSEDSDDADVPERVEKGTSQRSPLLDK
jgi:hypothetical protein